MSLSVQRAKRFQFSMRLMLIAMAIVAACAWWFSVPPKGMISRWQASRVRVGMDRDEVVRAVGWPVDTVLEEQMFSVWYYRVNRFPLAEEELVVTFYVDSGLVSSVYQYDKQ